MLTETAAIRRALLDANVGRRVRRRDRLDAHVLPGQDVDRRPRRAAQAAAAPAHAGQPGAAVGRDRHGLHEPQPGRARRPRVRLHPDPARRRPQDRRRARRATPRSPARGRRLGARRASAAPSCRRCGWPASATTCATSRSPRATRSRPSVRFGVSVNTCGVNDLVAVVDAVADADVDALVAEYADTYDVGAGAAPGGDRHESLRYGARIELGLRAFLDRRRLHGVHHELRGPRRAAPAARPRRAAADGRRLRLRRRGRLEDLGPAAHPQGRWPTGLPGGTSFMEDYTYHLVPGEEKILGAHMLEVCPSIAAARPTLEIHPLGIGGREDPVRLVFDAAPGAGRRRRPRRPRRPVPAASPTRSRSSPPDEPLPQLPVARAVWKPRARPAPPRPRPG